MLYLQICKKMVGEFINLWIYNVIHYFKKNNCQE